MAKALPNIYSIGMPKTGGTSLNIWLKQNTLWNVIGHDSLDIVSLLYNNDEPKLSLKRESRSNKRNTSEARTGMMHLHWKEIVEMDPDALFIMTVRHRVDTWAASFWRHFSRAQIGSVSVRNKSREILGLYKAPYSDEKNKTLHRIEKPGMVKLIKEYMDNQFEMAAWIANNPNACVISLDGGTSPKSMLVWMHDRIACQGNGSALPWSSIVYKESDVGTPIFSSWPHSRKAPEYDLPLWIVVECMDFDSMWQDQVMNQIL